MVFLRQIAKTEQRSPPIRLNKESRGTSKIGCHKQKQSSEKRKSMTWAQRLKRVFWIDIETCHQCAGVVKIIANIEYPVVIEKRLSHLHKKNEKRVKSLQPESRAAAQMSLCE